MSSVCLTVELVVCSVIKQCLSLCAPINTGKLPFPLVVIHTTIYTVVLGNAETRG